MEKAVATVAQTLWWAEEDDRSPNLAGFPDDSRSFVRLLNFFGPFLRFPGLR
jgi:hypothetical protein